MASTRASSTVQVSAHPGRERRGVGGPCGMGPFGVGLSQWRAEEEEGCEARSGPSGASFS